MSGREGAAETVAANGGAAALAAALDRDGYAVLPRYVGDGAVQAMLAGVREALPRLPPSGTAHCDALAVRAAPWAAVATDPAIVAAARHVLGPAAEVADRAKYRAPLAGFGAQKLHIDWVAPAPPYVILQVIIALTDFTAANGATRVVPGTHRRKDRPPPDGMPDETRLLGPAGTVFLMNGHVWHAGARNDAAAPRHAVFVPFVVKSLFRDDAKADE